MKFLVKPSAYLNGSVTIDGAKNSALPVLAACMLSEGTCELSCIPYLKDINSMCRLLSHIGCTVKRRGKHISVNSANISVFEAPYDLVCGFRGSFLTAAPLLAKYGRAKICLPGGCPIGQRPIDLHLKGFSAMGAEISTGSGYVELAAKKLHGAKIYLDFPSVGATENLMMAACLADGQTIIENAASEPEITDLATFLALMGADIKGAGTNTVRICGNSSLKCADHTIIPDRIETGTFMTAAAAVGGKIQIKNTVSAHMNPVTAKLREIGVRVNENGSELDVESDRHLSAMDIKTMPFPGFPTDMQAQFMALASVTPGTSIISETIFENRFMHAGELQRMGANIRLDGRTAIIEGVTSLSGAKVRATDLRAGAALVIAALCAEGETEIEGAELIDRGYEHLENKFRKLGCSIERV